jgi:hypothetical protein
MSASLERIRESWDVQESPQNKGVTLTIRITAYDNGMVQVDGIPINDHRHPDPVVGWLGAVDVVTSTIALFQREKSAPRTANVTVLKPRR